MSSIKPDNGSSKINCSQKILSPLIIACGNGSVLLECGKKVFNEMPCFVQLPVIVTGELTVALGRNDCRLAVNRRRQTLAASTLQQYGSRFRGSLWEILNLKPQSISAFQAISYALASHQSDWLLS